jgi:hypothetical protein
MLLDEWTYDSCPSDGMIWASWDIAWVKSTHWLKDILSDSGEGCLISHFGYTGKLPVRWYNRGVLEQVRKGST